MPKPHKTEYSKSIHSQYGQTNLETKVLAALQRAGKDLNALTRDDIVSFDEFHLGGRRATRNLAQLTGLREEQHVLDVGCGIGGAARTLAAEFGCRVTGIDLTEEYCRVAEMLTNRVGLSHKVTFRHGSALDLPFEDGTFDVVWLQHVSMNIEDKNRLFGEIHRVLQPRGRLALHEIMTGNATTFHLPVFWASDPSLNFLLTPREFRHLLFTGGFAVLAWNDVTEPSTTMIRKLHTIVETDGLPPLGINVIVSTDVPVKIVNTLQNLEEGRIVAIQAVAERAE